MRIRSGLLALVLGMALAPAQEMSIDLPHQRSVVASQANSVERGLVLLDAGWLWEARRAFREALLSEELQAVGHLGLALASKAQPRVAANASFRAFEKRADGGSKERAVVEAYARYFDAEVRPPAADEVFDRPPPAARRAALLEDLRRIAAADADGIAARLLAYEEARNRAEADAPAGRRAKLETLRAHNAYLAASGLMPFLVPGYRDLLESVLQADESGEDLRAQLARLPRHPHLGGGQPVGPMPGLSAGTGTDAWRPRQAPAFDLLRGLGGRDRLENHAGRPLLVVFFLGFG
ncbi:MAG: hypothetical protein VYE77_03375 [Planctomycetota bacterium]|nr:hypothetical protein [Planctomycetota bacterium]